MGTIHTMTENMKRLDERYKIGSLTEGGCGHEFDFNGANSITAWTLDTGTINDYNMSPSAGNSRFGEMEEVGDTKATYTLYGNKSFDRAFDNQNIKETGFIRKAGSYLKSIWDEELIPILDKDRLEKWTIGAGLGKVNSTALTKSTIIEAILEAHADMNNKLAPRDRITYVTESVAVKAKLADELKYNEGFTKDSIINGKIARLNNSDIIAIPDSLMPAGIEFVIKAKNASLDALTIKTLRAIENSEALDGVRMQGRIRYGSFVRAQKRNGIFVYAQTGMCDKVTYSISTNDVSLSCATTGATIKYTTDGSDPMSSSTVATYSAAVTITADTKFRAYAEKSGLIAGPITEYNAIKS